MDRAVAAQPTERVGQRAAAMRDHESDTGKSRQMSGEEQPRHRDRRIGQPADRVDQIIAVEPVVAANVHRMQKDRRVACRGDLPERVELGGRRDFRRMPLGCVPIIAPLKPASIASSSTRAASAPFCNGTVASGIRASERIGVLRKVLVEKRAQSAASSPCSS